MRRPGPIVTLALAGLVGLGASGCGTSDSTPVACLDGAGAYIDALGKAPGEVRLSGGVPIGDCLSEHQSGGDLATVGASMVEAATRLNSTARAGGGALRLGYLIGAARRGADRTAGIHTELIRRLTAAARYSPAYRPLPVRFLHAYRRGLAAGQAHG